jgi:hypothetical protein
MQYLLLKDTIINFFYFINLILLNIDNDNYSFIYEGNEDIDMYIDDKIYSIIQIKYHNSINNTINENLTDKGGLKKVLLNFIEKYFKYILFNYK